MKIAQVIVDIAHSNVDKVFDYLVPDELDIQPGSRVLVPFGNQKTEGFIITLNDSTKVPKDKLKQIIKPLDDFVAIKEEHLKLLDIMTENLHLKKVDVLRLFIPSDLRGGNVSEKKTTYAKLLVSKEEALSKIRANSIKQLELIGLLSKGDTRISGTEYLVVSKTLEKKGIIKTYLKQQQRIPMKNIERVADKKFNHTDDQKKAISEIEKSLNTSCTFLIHGITGSGKTEVYMSIIDRVVGEGKNAIMLVPEISLTPRMLELFRSRFGDDVAIIHSGLSAGERFDEWLKLNRKEAKIVIGARSAIFSPLENVGVIIIDEEHDGGYISDNTPRYETYDVAKYRSELNSCPIILGSATPAISTYYKAKKGEIKLIEMLSRVNEKALPKVDIVDMRKELKEGNTSCLSSKLVNELAEVVKNKQQAIILINRRGYSSFLRCRECGYVPHCTTCDVSLTYHKYENILKCHYCNNRYKVLDVCPVCGSTNIKEYGLGTEKVCEEIESAIPGAKTIRMDFDSTNIKDGHYKILKQFSDGKANILVGTQMVAKGHDFPLVTFVGILDADLSLHFPDYKANERTFQLITQVAGRAGRDKIEGKVLLQTYVPNHYVLVLGARQDYKAFYQKEINIRETTKFPPFSEIYRIMFQSKNENDLSGVVSKIYGSLQLKVKGEKLIYMQKMYAPIKKLSGNLRYQIIIRAKDDSFKQDIFNSVKLNTNNKVSCWVELNPQNLN